MRNVMFIVYFDVLFMQMQTWKWKNITLHFHGFNLAKKDVQLKSYPKTIRFDNQTEN